MTDKEIRALIEKRRKDWRYRNSVEAKYKAEECDDILELMDEQEEHVSEDLEDAAEDYCKSTLVGSHSIKKNAFKAGANWQKEKVIIKVCKWFNDNACNYFGHMPAYPFIDDLRKAMED